MSAMPSTTRVEKALFASPSAVRSASTASDLQKPPALSPSLPQNTPAVAAATSETGVSSLSSKAMAAVSDVITDDLRQLSRDDIDVKQWLNATLSCVLETAKAASAASGDANNNNSNSSNKTTAPSATRKSLQIEEQLVQLLQARVQTHSQELSASIEDLISNTLVRLPRTTMELSRMSAVADELIVELQSIEAIVQPAVSAKSDAYVTQLHLRKASEVKLCKCMRLLEKAARVEENIRNIQYLVDHREAKAGNVNNNNNNNGGPSSSSYGADVLKKSTDAANKTTIATRQRDLDEVAGIIRQVRDDLKEITAVDDTFGEQYKVQLEQFEQYIEQALEEECVACLRAHQLERATRLITTLHSIGRADAVLKRYGEQAAAQMIDQQEAKLRAVSSGQNEREKGSRASAAAAVAELLRSEIIPDDSAFLSQELVFLSDLVRGAAAAVADTAATPPAASTTAERDAGTTSQKSTSSSGDNHVSSIPQRNGNTSSSSPNAKGTPTTSAGAYAVEDDPRAVQVLEVLEVLYKKLHAPVQATLQPLLMEWPGTTNKDYVACYTATQQIKVSLNSIIDSGTISPASSGVAVTTRDPLEQLAREVTHRAIAFFTSVFKEEKVLERYADRVCIPISVYCAQPLAKILASSASASDDSLSHVLTQAVQEVLVYVPEKISARCMPVWHAQLSKTLVQQLQPTPSTSQHVLLQHLYLQKQRIKPLLVKTQQAVEDWLSSGSIRELYPTSAGLLRMEVQTRLWTPLKLEVEEVQRATQLYIVSGITQPILVKVEQYTKMPCWGNQIEKTRTGSSGSQNGIALVASTLGLYTQGQVAPSSAVRDMGEMLMELPLTLETLASTAVTESYQSAAGDSNTSQSQSAASASVIPVNDTDTEEGVRMLIEEQAEEWLETVVRNVVRVFLSDKVLPLKIGPFADAQQQQQQEQQQPGEERANASKTEATTQLYSMALEQLITDLDYLRNILSAVNEESQETVQRVMSAIRALPSARQSAFTVGEAIEMATCEAVEDEDERKKAAVTGAHQSGSN